MLTSVVDEGWRTGFEEGRPVKKLGAGSSVCEGQRHFGGCPAKGKGSYVQLVLAKLLVGSFCSGCAPNRRIDGEESAMVAGSVPLGRRRSSSLEVQLRGA
jgi:hypothetical protein